MYAFRVRNERDVNAKIGQAQDLVPIGAVGTVRVQLTHVEQADLRL